MHQSHFLKEHLIQFLRHPGFEIIQEGKQPEKISFIGAIICSIVSKVEKFGTDLSILKNLKQNLSNMESAEFPLSFLEEKIIEVLLLKKSTLIKVNYKGELLKQELLQECIVVDLKQVINQTFPGLSISRESLYIESIDQSEIKAIQMLRNKKFQSVNFIKKGNKIDRAEAKQNIDKSKRIIDLIRDSGFQSIELKQEDGKTVYISRTIKKKF